jgi:hypothetical protein
MALLAHPAFLDRLPNTNVMTADLVMQALKMAFPNIKNILIGDAMYNSANDGKTDSLTDIWGKHFWIGYISDKPTLKSRSFGYTYQKN